MHDYLTALAKLLPVLKNLHLLPASAKVPDIPEKPDCLMQFERIERWGFANPGTWLDQPKQYMDDVEAARRGRTRYDNETLMESQAAYDMKSLPFPKPLGLTLAG